MIGLDRASIWVLVDAHIELIDIGIRKKYRHILGRKVLGNTQNYSIGKENINEINMTKNERSSLDGIIVSSQWEGINYSGTLFHSSLYEVIPLDPNVASDFEKYLGGRNG